MVHYYLYYKNGSVLSLVPKNKWTFKYKIWECKLGPHIIVQVLDFLGELDLIEKAMENLFGEAGLQC